MKLFDWVQGVYQNLVHKETPDQPRVRQVPLSAEQKRVWFLSQLTPDSAVHHVSAVLRLCGNLDGVRLERSFQVALNRHEVLRATFTTSGGEPVQLILPSAQAPFRVTTIRVEDMAEAACAEWVQQVLSQQARQPFLFQQQPLICGNLISLGNQTHIFHVVSHALVANEYALRRFMAEVAAFYNQAGEPCAAHHYADFVAWQVEWKESDEGKTAVSYWKNQLATTNALFELPTDHPRPPMPTFSARKFPFKLPPLTQVKLAAFCQNEGYTADLVLLAAWMVLLFRYTNNQDVVVGTVSPDPYQAYQKGIIGPCHNHLVLRLPITADLTPTHLLQNLANVVAAAKQHQRLPFSDVVDYTHPVRELSHAPLFQMLFLWDELAAPPNFAGLTAEWLTAFNQTSRYDMTLALHQMADGAIGGTLIYNNDLFDVEMGQQLGEQYLQLVTSFLEKTDVSVGQLPLLTDAQYRLMLKTWNDTQIWYPHDWGIHHYFERQTLKTPEKPALYANGRFLTYHQLNQQANRLAHYLQTQGITQGALVGVCLERSAELLIALLAILKAGAAYVPLDPAYPAERIHVILENAQVTLLLTHSAQNITLPVTRSLHLDELQLAHLPDTNPHTPLTGGELAYVIYTSGSTGLPKGVEITHQNASALISWAGEVYEEDELTAVLAATSICFDLSIFELFVPLAYGGMVVLVQNVLELVYQPPPIAITLINSVPSAVAELVFANAIPPSIQTVNLAGEPFRYQLVHQLYAAGARRVFNLYGPSEDTTYSTYALLDPHGSLAERPSIGRPISNTQIYLLDNQMQPVPPGATGEIYIGGDGLARGYRNRPDLTQEKFIPSPFLPAKRLYRTGDLAKYRRDGQLEFIGRQDHQIKLRGYRIELGEIETVLEQHSAVHEAVVIVRYLTPDAPVLAAYVTTAHPHDNLTTALQLYLEQKLPNYMVPAYFTLLPAMPRTPNGKVDRKALPEIRPFSPPATPLLPNTDDWLEEKLLKIWREVLNVPALTTTDDFFDLGGNSLLAVRLMARIEQETGYKLPLSTLF